MLENIAVGHLQNFRLGDILLFDKIYVHSLDTNIESFMNTYTIFALTLEELRSQGILEEIPTEAYDKKIEEDYPMEPSIGSDLDAIDMANYALNFVMDKKVRLWELAVQLRGDFGVLLVDEHALINPMSKTAKSAKVLEFRLRGLPQPHWNAPIDQLIKLRLDPAARESLNSIHDWVRAIAMTNLLNDKALVEELVYRLHAYKELLSSSFEVIYEEERIFCCASKDVLKDEARLQISEPYDQLFSAVPRVISLMDPEIGDPGRELAIVRTTR